MVFCHPEQSWEWARTLQMRMRAGLLLVFSLPTLASSGFVVHLRG